MTRSTELQTAFVFLAQKIRSASNCPTLEVSSCPPAEFFFDGSWGGEGAGGAGTDISRLGKRGSVSIGRHTIIIVNKNHFPSTRFERTGNIGIDICELMV